MIPVQSNHTVSLGGKPRASGDDPNPDADKWENVM